MHVKMLECNYIATQLKPTVCTKYALHTHMQSYVTATQVHHHCKVPAWHQLCTKYALHTRNAILCDCYTGTPAPVAARVGGSLLSSLEEEASQSILEGEFNVDIRFVGDNS